MIASFETRKTKKTSTNMSDSTTAEAPAYDPAAAAATAPTPAPGGFPGAGGGGGRGRGRGRGRGGGGIAIEGIAELDASMGRGAPIPPAAGGGKPLPKKEQKDFRGPAGLFKQGDWTCTACGNVNWERRSTCNKCNNQKPNLANTEEVGWNQVTRYICDSLQGSPSSSL